MFSTFLRIAGALARASVAPALGLILLFGGGTAAAQAGPGGPGGSTGVGGASGQTYQGPMTQHPLVIAATPFQWTTTSGLGPVKVPFPGQFGWTHIVGLDFQARVVPSVSTDPTIEVILYPPASGHPTKAERITVQFPMDPDRIRGSGAMVLAFHSFGVSEKDIFVNTTLPQECAKRGWLLVAPYGLVDTHYGNVPSQESLDTVLELVDLFFDWNPERVYGVGFSMGGGAALSYAMRHQDGSKMRLAGVVNHTGTMDLISTYGAGTSALKLLMADKHHFGAPPVDQDSAFPYERVSPVVFNGFVVDPTRAPVRNLSHLPIYQFVNLNDPQGELVNQNLAVAAYLQGEGVNVNLVTGNLFIQHAWSTMNMAAALDWIQHYKLNGLPTDTPVFADETTDYFHTSVRAKPALRVASYVLDVDVPSNLVQISESRQLDSLVLDLRGMGLDTGLVVTGTWASADGTGDELVLRGYPTAPSQVFVGGVLSTTWTHDPLLGEVTFQVPAGSSLVWSVSR